MKHLKTITLAITLSLSHSQTFAMETPTQPEQTHPNETAQDPETLVQQALAYFKEDEDRERPEKIMVFLKKASNLKSPNYLGLGDTYAELDKTSKLYQAGWLAHKFYAKAFLNGQKKEALERLGRLDHFWIKESTEYKHFPDFVKGQYRLSQICSYGDNTFFSENELDIERRKSLYFDLLLKAADNGFPPAQYDLGQRFSILCWKAVENIPPNRQKYDCWFDEDIYAKFNQTLFWFKKAARQGHTESCLSLGELFWYAPEWLRNEAKSKKYFLKACAINPENFIKIADSFKDGKSFCDHDKMTKDIYQASIWYKKALDSEAAVYKKDEIECFLKKYPFEEAKNGNAEAQYKVGLLHFEGKDIPKDLQKALDLLHLSAEQKHIPAQMKLGEIYAYNKLGINTQDLKRAQYWYTQAHECGDSSGLLSFAGSFEHLYLSYEIYENLYDEGNIDVIARLGVMFFDGNTVPVDRKKAFELFLESAQKQNKTVIPEMKTLFQNYPTSMNKSDISPEAVEEIHAFRESCEGLSGYYLDFLSKFNGRPMAGCFGQSFLVKTHGNKIAEICEGYMNIIDDISIAGFLVKAYYPKADKGPPWPRQISPYFSLTIHNLKKKYSDEYTSLVWDGLEVINDETIEASFLRFQDVNTKAIDLLEKCDFKDNTILDVIKMSNENLHEYLSAVLQYQLKESDSDKMIEIIKVLKNHQIEIETHLKFALQMRERLLTLLDDTQDYRNWIFHQALNG